MSRHRKPPHAFGQKPAPPPPPARPAHGANGATPPPGDTTAELVALRALIEETRRELNGRLDDLVRRIDRLLPEHKPAPPAAPAQSPSAVVPAQPPARALAPVHTGDEVYVPSLGGTYTVVEVAASGQTFKVQAGQMRVQVRRDEVWTLDEERASKKAAGATSHQRPYHDAAIREIDLHGFSEEEAVTTLELFLHHEYTRRTTRVRIIHGKGNGTLRAAVRRELAHSPLVRSVETGPHFQGDDGVTLAELDV